MSAALHFDLYVPNHALLVAFILTAPLVVDRCHSYWLWALFYLKVGAVHLASFVRITILRQLPPPGRPPDWRRRLPYHMMKRIRRRRFWTKSELLKNRSLPILVGYGALPYSRESLHEFICALNPLVVPRLLHNGGPWTLSIHTAQQQRKDRRYRRRDALRTSSAIQHVLRCGNSLFSTQRRFLCVASISKSVYLGLNAADAPIVIDSGASLSISPNRGDFVGDIEQLNSTIQGISTVTKIAGVGTVHWTFKDVFGTIKIIETHAYYIPDAGVRLFSPQVYFQEQQAGSYLMTSTNTVLTTDDGCVLTLGYQLGSNLPMVPPPAVCALSRVNHSRVNLSFEDSSSDSVACSLSVVDKENQNLSAPEKELLEEHWKKFHVDAQRLQALMRESDGQPPIIATKHAGTRS
jgi:hypothetical protein